MIDDFSQWRPFKFAIGIAKAFVGRLLVEGRFELAEAIAKKLPSWRAVFLLVPLACAGREIDLDRLASGMAALKRRFPLDANTLGQPGLGDTISPYVIDIVLSAAEILVGHGIHSEIATAILSPFLDSDLRRIDKRNDFEVPLLDAILRSYCLSEAMGGKAVSASDVLKARPLEPKDGASERARLRHDSPLKDIIAEITPVYAERAQIFASIGRASVRA